MSVQKLSELYRPTGVCEQNQSIPPLPYVILGFRFLSNRSMSGDTFRFGVSDRVGGLSDAPIEQTVLDGFGDMPGLHLGGLFEVGDGAADAPDLVVGTGG